MPLKITALPKALNALRQAAIERVRFFQAALEERGVLTRMGAELEFFPLNKAGVPQPDILDAKFFTRELAGRISTVERIYREMSISDAQYELVTGLSKKLAGGNIRLSGPLQTAETVAAFKAGMRAIAPKWGLGGVSFAARMRSGTILENSGLHINTSLWNKGGDKNLFYSFGHATTDLERHVADSLIKTHATTGSAYFPRPESFERIANSAVARSTLQGVKDVSSGVPTRAGVMFNKGMTLGNTLKALKSWYKGEPEIASIAARHRSIPNMPLGILTQTMAGRTVMIGWERPHQYRLESRLAGADADPYVVVATELASIYEAVTRNTVFSKHCHVSVPKGSVRVDLGKGALLVKKHSGKFAQERLALDSTTAHEALLANDRMRRLLGEDLYHGIVTATRPQNVPLNPLVAESIGHFQKYVRSAHGKPHDTSSLTIAMHDALADMQSPRTVDRKTRSWRLSASDATTAADGITRQ